MPDLHATRQRPRALKEFRTGRDREGEAPAEPLRTRTCRNNGSAFQFLHSYPWREVLSLAKGGNLGAQFSLAPRW
jgi:hypothetical protein